MYIECLDLGFDQRPERGSTSTYISSQFDTYHKYEQVEMQVVVAFPGVYNDSQTKGMQSHGHW